MAQWGQGYQYPLQTGFNPQQFQQQGFPQSAGGIAPQPTGFPGQQPRPAGFQQAQPTGYPGSGNYQQPQVSGFVPQPTGFQPQPTGFQGGNFQQQQRAPPPPVPPIPPQFQQQNAQPNNFLGGPPPQANRFLSSSPGPLLTAQPTGFPGVGGLRPLVAQPTGFIDPRLQMMQSQFLPANPSAPYTAAGLPQFQLQSQDGVSLQQSFQQHNQARGTTAPKVPWALSKGEKKSYDQIFRAWDHRGEGFITGQTALEVFGQSGLDKNDLAQIWSLADVDNRGKLNLPEFYVAMGLIYRRLNGNEIPDELPKEMVPPSARDLDDSVDFLKRVLQNDTRARSPSNFDSSSPVSRLKERSFNSTSAPGAGGRQDATVYKYTDESPPGGFYQPPTRHVDRKSIRTQSDRDSPAADLDDMKRQLENTAKMLDRTAAENAARTAEDDALDREMSDLRYRVKRLQDDLEYVSRGPRSFSKDDERRKLERELMGLLHDKLPDLERKIKDRDERKKREQREWDRERDKRNDRFGRFADREANDGYSSRYDRDEDRDRYRSYDRDRDFDRDRERDRDRDWDRDRPRDRDYDRDRPYSRNKDRDYDRPRSPATRSSPPAPSVPSPATSSTLAKPASSPAPSASPAPSTKNMTPEERKAFIQAEAQRRMQARMAALGVVSPSTGSPRLDTSVEDRLAKEKQEAEEKARAAEKEAEDRERLRRERLEGEKAFKEGVTSPTKTEPEESPSSRKPLPRKPTTALKAAPPPPKPRTAPAPPPSRKAAAPRPPPPRAPAASFAPPPPAPPPAPVVPEVDPVEQQLKARENALRKAREERLERLRRMEEEEEEEAKRLEEEYKARREQRSRQTPVEASPARVPPAPPAPAVYSPSPAPVPPAPAPPTPAASTPSAEKSKNNPFSRLMREGSTSASASPSTSTNGSTNPFFKPTTQAAAPPAPEPPAPPPAPTPPALARPTSVPVPTKSPTPTAIKTSYHTAPGESDDDWDDVREKSEDDSSEDELDASRDSRNKLAQQLFGSILPPSRPQSAAPAGQTSQPATPATPAPPAPPPSAPPQFAELSTAEASGAPPPPPPPGPPPPPAPAAPVAAPVAAPAPSGDRNALLDAIQAGAKLRKAVTNDRSGTSLSGKVIGDTAPPPHISIAPTPSAPSPPIPEPALRLPAMSSEGSSKSSHRESVGWYAGLAADEGDSPQIERMPSMAEELEEEAAGSVPHIHVDTAQEGGPLDDIDLSVEYRVRALYAYEGEISFPENVVLKAHPSKSGGDWWYGTVVREGKSGLFPQTYVQRFETNHAKALYSYQSAGPEQLSFEEEDDLAIVERADPDWWRAEKDGMVYIVPAAYLEIVEAGSIPSRLTPQEVLPPGTNMAQNGMDYSPPILQVTLSANHDDAMGMGGNISDSDSNDDSESWATASESYDSDEETTNVTEEDRSVEREARETERQRVLEAAGLIVKAEKNPPPRPARVKSFRKRRAPADIPQRTSTTSGHRRQKSLPAVPEPDPNQHAYRLDDAYERYEAYKQAHGNLNRLSVASVETSPSLPSLSVSSPPPRSPSIEISESRTHSILQFFGLKAPSHESEARPMPVISSPISGPISGPVMTREPTPIPVDSGPVFGSSWASLVDKSVVEEIPAKERRRQEAIFEFISTEAAYVRDLQLIVEVFYRGLLPHLDEKAATVIFANVEDILLTNTTFLSCLEERQKECRLYIDRIGDLLSDNMAQMGIYREYCVNQAIAIKVLQSLRETKPEIAAHLQRLRDDPVVRNLDLSSYLLVPSKSNKFIDLLIVLNEPSVQRATRYPLLIKQVLHYTETEDDREQIQRALEMSEKILKHINETIREQEGKERLTEISKDLWIGQGRLDLTANTRNMGPRRLLKEGILTKAKSGRKLRAFLCSDILVLTVEISRSLYDLPIPLSEIQVKATSRDDTIFNLVRPYPRGGDAIRLRALSSRDCQSWMEAIDIACRKCKTAEKRAAKT